MSGYIGNIPVPQATQTRQSFTATASQTTFNTAGYSPGYIDVFLNGVKLAPADYTATNGSDVVLAVGAASNDILEIVAYEIFQVVDQAFTGNFSVDSPTFVVDSTNNRVGIGTASPAELLNLSSSEPVIRFTDSDDGNYHHLFSSSDDFYISADRNNTGSGNLIFRNGGTSERMRIDSSGNLLVGGTSAGGSSTFTAYADGQIHAYRGTATGRAATFTATTSEVGYFNRLSTDGDIVQFAKNGTTVGSIGVGNTNRPYIGGGDTGIMFDATNNAIYPWDTSTNNVPASDQVDLGYNATGLRFKDLYLSGGLRGDTTFKNNAGTTEYARFDSSGNLLVGKTSADVTTAGARIFPTGDAAFVTNSSAPIIANRLTSDGDLAIFRKDGTTVGSIGVNSSDQLFISRTTGSQGIKFKNGGAIPCNADGSDSDNDQDLGTSSARWQDLYLSGGVYLGGTGAVNKLDDYEEGTWTPVLTNYSGTYGSQVGTYTKVGNLVSFSFYLETGTAAGAGNINVGGLPFASASGSNRYHAYQGWANSWDSNGAVQYLLGAGATYMNMYNVVTSGGVTSTTVADIGSGANIIVSGTYTTDA
jgi:hypothetical protein